MNHNQTELMYLRCAKYVSYLGPGKPRSVVPKAYDIKASTPDWSSAADTESGPQLIAAVVATDKRAPGPVLQLSAKGGV